MLTLLAAWTALSALWSWTTLACWTLLIVGWFLILNLLEKLKKYVDSQISKDKELLTHHQKVLEQMMENHRTELAKHLHNNEGI